MLSLCLVEPQGGVGTAGLTIEVGDFPARLPDQVYAGDGIRRVRLVVRDASRDRSGSDPGLPLAISPRHEVGLVSLGLDLEIASDADGLEFAHDRRVRDSTTARGLTSIGAARLASMPLVVDSEM